MAYILAQRHQSTLARFARSNVMIGFDYDGTLAPIVSVPARASMRGKTRRLLRAVARRYPCVVISGRDQADVARHVGSVPVWHVSGNHGIEPWARDEAYLPQVRDWVCRLQATLAPWAGVIIEAKRYSVTIHYRRARQKEPARKAINRAVRLLRGARVIGGKEAINLVPVGAPHKGAALERVRRQLACDTAIYVGDDETDEDVFANASTDQVLGIRVGRASDSRAAYWLKNQAEVDRLLQRLLTLRPLRRPARG